MYPFASLGRHLLPLIGAIHLLLCPGCSPTPQVGEAQKASPAASTELGSTNSNDIRPSLATAAPEDRAADPKSPGIFPQVVAPGLVWMESRMANEWAVHERAAPPRSPTEWVHNPALLFWIQNPDGLLWTLESRILPDGDGGNVRPLRQFSVQISQPANPVAMDAPPGSVALTALGHLAGVHEGNLRHPSLTSGLATGSRLGGRYPQSDAEDLVVMTASMALSKLYEHSARNFTEPPSLEELFTDGGVVLVREHWAPLARYTVLFRAYCTPVWVNRNFPAGIRTEVILILNGQQQSVIAVEQESEVCSEISLDDPRIRWISLDDIPIETADKAAEPAS